MFSYVRRRFNRAIVRRSRKGGRLWSTIGSVVVGRQMARHGLVAYFVDSSLFRLQRHGFRRAADGSQLWLSVGILATGSRALRTMAHEPPQTLGRVPLHAGDRLEVGARETR